MPLGSQNHIPNEVQMMQMNESTQANLPAAAEADSDLPIQLVKDTGRRLASIDALRGFDMFWLLQDETGLMLALAALLHLPYQDVLAKQLDHTPWIGITAWDMIAPLFLFIVGLTLPLSLESRRKRGESDGKIVSHILRRTVVLILLGLVYNGILQMQFADFRYTGVLQRIALSYVFAALITFFCKTRGQIAWTVALLLGYWAIMALIPVPGFGRNVMTPQGNLEGYIDRLFLPGKFCCYIFGDNEGYLSTIPSIATVMLGVLSSYLLKFRRSDQWKTMALLAGGVASILLGLLWSIWFPIITRLWTSSYTLLCNGVCMILFAAFFWVIDVKGYKKWAFFFIVIGLNPLLIYVLQEIIDFKGIGLGFLGGIANHAGAQQLLITAIGTVAAKWLFLYFLYRQKIFIKT
jgi:predicted acyltransferase